MLDITKEDISNLSDTSDILYGGNQDEINEKKEQMDVTNEIITIDKYKNKLQLTNYAYDDEIQVFINNTINKYRYKMEVMNFYNSPNSHDVINNQYDTLCLLEQMIFQYAIIKNIDSINTN